MMGGMACICLSDLGTGLADSLWTLLVARLGLGLGRGYAEAGERGMLADLLAGRSRRGGPEEEEDWRGRGLALQQACVAVGIACGAAGGGVLVEKFGVRSGFFCVSFAAAVCLALYSFLPETLVDYRMMDGEIKSNIIINTTTESDSTNSSDNSDEWIRLLTTSPTWRSLAICQCGASFGYACKIAIIPVLAANYLPGGIAGAGFLLSSAGLMGLIGASLGGYLTDRLGSRFAVISAGLLSGVAFALVPFGLSLIDDKVESSSLALAEFHILDMGIGSASFVALVLLWSIGASAQGPALVALAQQEAPPGKEATALGLPRAFGDGTYIIAPLILGYASDVAGQIIPGVACAVAGFAICLGSVALLAVSSASSSFSNK